MKSTPSVPPAAAGELSGAERSAVRDLSGMTCANVTTTARYLNVKDDYLQELIERKPLVLVR